MDGNIEVICTDPSAPAYEWEFVASVHYEADGTDANTFTKEIGEANARLIVAACNAAQEINPENPIAAAESIAAAMQALKRIANWEFDIMGDCVAEARQVARRAFLDATDRK